jgi:hypothetical protein
MHAFARRSMPRRIPSYSRSFISWARAPVQSRTSAGRLYSYRQEYAAAAGMKGRHRFKLGPYLVCSEGVACGAWQARILPHDSGSDPLTGEMRTHGGPARKHIEPLGKQTVFAEPICLRFGRVRRRDSVEALPPSRKGLGRGKGGLPAIEVGPRKIRSAGISRHCGPFDQEIFRPAVMRVFAIGGPEIMSRPTAASHRIIGHEGSNSDRCRLNFADRGWA